MASWILLLTPAAGAAPAPRSDEFKELVKIATAGRYTEEEGVSIEVDPGLIPGWSECPVPLKLFKYSHKENGGPDFLPVIVCSPTPENAAKWIVDAVEHNLKSYDHQVARHFAAFVKLQSGFQFPVRGFVGREFGNEIYVFFDGVSIKTKAQGAAAPMPLTPFDREKLITYEPTQKEKRILRKLKRSEDPTSKQKVKILEYAGVPYSDLVHNALLGTVEETLEKSGHFARVFSLHRNWDELINLKKYKHLNLNIDANYLKFVRERHIAAVGKDENELARLKFELAFGKDRNKCLERLLNGIRGSSKKLANKTDAEITAWVNGL